MVDVATVPGGGSGCADLPDLFGNLAVMALSLKCSMATQVTNAEFAGAFGVILINNTGADAIFAPTGLFESFLPAVLISKSNGANVLSYLKAHPSAQASLDPSIFAPVEVSTFNNVASKL